MSVTDKDKENARVFLEKIFSGKPDTGSWHGINDKWPESELVEMQAERDSRIRTKSADQARKEAAEIAVAFVDNNMTGLSDCDIGLLTDLRSAILGDSTTDHIANTGKKLSIAVKALEDIVYLYAGNASIIARNALKEIQG